MVTINEFGSGTCTTCGEKIIGADLLKHDCTTYLKKQFTEAIRIIDNLMFFEHLGRSEAKAFLNKHKYNKTSK